MAVITISAIELGPELVSGIPRYVALETNVPATIFYTTDGSSPTTLSSVYIDPILLPDNLNTIELKSLAVSGSDIGYLHLIFRTSTLSIHKTRRIEGYGAGIVIDAYGEQWVFYDGYSLDSLDEANVPARFSDYPLDELEIKYSETGFDGIGKGTFPRPGPVPKDVTDRSSAIGPEESSPNDNNVYFDPRALYIVIDGRMDDGYKDQSVFPINRPHSGTMNPVKYLGGRMFFDPQPYISGGLVRTMYNYNTGIMTSYYFDSNESRWIKSIQKFDKDKVPDNIGSRRQFGPPLVFKWIWGNRNMI